MWIQWTELSKNVCGKNYCFFCSRVRLTAFFPVPPGATRTLDLLTAAHRTTWCSSSRTARFITRGFFAFLAQKMDYTFSDYDSSSMYSDESVSTFCSHFFYWPFSVSFVVEANGRRKRSKQSTAHLSWRHYLWFVGSFIVSSFSLPLGWVPKVLYLRTTTTKKRLNDPLH